MLIWSLGIGAAAALWVSLRADAPPWAIVVVPVALLASAALFATLTIEVTDREVRVAFGPGLIRRRLRVDDIAAARAVRNPWYYGWGIHLTPHGWLFNVAGLDAVEIELRSGKKLRVGSDQPQRLLTAIRQARAEGAG